MLKNTKVIISVSAVLLVGIFYWYFFVDTLKLTQITGKPDNPFANIFVSIIDFDTGLTRYDISNLSKKSAYWRQRMQDVSSIQDPERRNTENTKLLAEMMGDPALKKILQKTASVGTNAVFSILIALK